jgi:hypothetical protein
MNKAIKIENEAILMTNSRVDNVTNKQICHSIHGKETVREISADKTRCQNAFVVILLYKII